MMKLFSVNYEQELQGKQKLYLEVLFRNCNLGNTDLGLKPQLFQMGKKETEFVKREKLGMSKGSHKLVCKSSDWCWQADLHCAIYMINCLCLPR